MVRQPAIRRQRSWLWPESQTIVNRDWKTTVWRWNKWWVNINQIMFQVHLETHHLSQPLWVTSYVCHIQQSKGYLAYFFKDWSIKRTPSSLHISFHCYPLDTFDQLHKKRGFDVKSIIILCHYSGFYLIFLTFIASFLHYAFTSTGTQESLL